jgi:vesicle coat complex subunit
MINQVDIRWGQIAILTAIAEYTPTDESDAVTVCERVLPRVQHANASVVLAAIKVILNRHINRSCLITMMTIGIVDLFTIYCQ